MYMYYSGTWEIYETKTSLRSKAGIPVRGTGWVCVSGSVTKGKVPGWAVTVWSNRMRFMVRVKSSRTSLESLPTQSSSLQAGGELHGINIQWNLR